MGNTTSCTGSVRGVHDSIKARTGSTAAELHDVNRDLQSANLGFLSGTDLGQRLARVARENGTAGLGVGAGEGASPYAAMAATLIRLYDTSGDGYLQPQEALTMVTALCQVFLTFDGSSALVGADFTPQERELAIAEMTEELLLMLYDEEIEEEGGKEGGGEEKGRQGGKEEADADGIGPKDLAKWLARIERQHLLGSLTAMTTTTTATVAAADQSASSAVGKPPASAAAKQLASGASFVGFPPAK